MSTYAINFLIFVSVVCGINKNLCILLIDVSDAALDLLADESFQIPTKGNEICIKV